MQAFSLYHFLKENIDGAEVKIIDLIPTKRELHELLFFQKRFPYFSIYKLLKYIRLSRFNRINLERTKRFYSNDLDKQIEFINKQGFDYVITGSDTVWFKNSNLKNQIPNIYFLPEKIKGKKISYAASVDPLNDENYYLERKNEIKKMLNKFSLITVRDRATFELMQKLDIDKVIKVIDPTLIYPFEKKMQIKISDKKVDHVKKIGIGIVDKNLATKVIRFLEEKHYEVFNFFDGSIIKTDFLIDELNLYHQFDCIITDRFHRTIFALKLSKSLVIYIENKRFNKNSNSKGRDLLERIGMIDNIVNSGDENFEQYILNQLRNFQKQKQEIQNKLFENFVSSEKEVVINLIKETIL